MRPSEILKIGTTTTSKFFGSSRIGKTGARTREEGIKEKGRVYLLRSGKTEGNPQRNKYEVKKDGREKRVI